MSQCVRRADKDKAEIQQHTELQERALDGIDSALDDLAVMSKVRLRPNPCCRLGMVLSRKHLCARATNCGSLVCAAVILWDDHMPRLAGRHTSICVVDLGVALCVQHMNVELDDQNRRVDAVGARAENTHDEIRRALRLCLHQLFEYGRKSLDSACERFSSM